MSSSPLVNLADKIKKGGRNSFVRLRRCSPMLTFPFLSERDRFFFIHDVARKVTFVSEDKYGNLFEYNESITNQTGSEFAVSQLPRLFISCSDIKFFVHLVFLPCFEEFVCESDEGIGKNVDPSPNKSS